MKTIRWGIVGCGEVCEVKSGPGFQKAEGSALVAVMRRDRAKAEDFARRHGVPRVHATAEDLINDPDVDAVYIATHPNSHSALALLAAEAGKPCLVEKPMATLHAECVRMLDAFRRAQTPLWVAYYRRAVPRTTLLAELIEEGAIGRLTSVHVRITDRLANPELAKNWRFDPERSGAGLFFDLASHCFDLVDFLVGPVRTVHGIAVNTGGAYQAEDATAAAFECEGGVIGTGIWNFNAGEKTDTMTLIGTEGELATSVFADTDVVITRAATREVHPVRNPAHVHQPLIQTIVNELRGSGRSPSTGESAARTSWVLERCVESYYGVRS